MRGEDWSREEVEATVADYLRMLRLELSGQEFSKTVHRKELIRLLSDRSMGAIELKHQNISSVLLELGFPYIRGYKPRGNYQQLLFEVVSDRVESDELLQSAAGTAAIEDVTRAPQIKELRSVLVPVPRFEGAIRAPRTSPYVRRAFRRNYLELEAKNAAIGLAGEVFVADFEARRLHEAGQPSLADRVEHVAATRGDGLGHDVLSFEIDGREKYIEVKTTTFGAITPIFVSDSEVRFSEEQPEQFVLARVHEFRNAPKFFELRGSLRKTMQLEPIVYSGRLN